MTTLAQDRYLFGTSRETILQRDGYKCVQCGLSRAEHIMKFKRDLNIDHIDGKGKKTPKAEKNNDPTNLQTLCAQCHGRKDVQRKVITKGADHGAAKLTENQVINIRHLKGELRQIDIAKLYGVSKTLIGDIHRNEKWRHLA